MDLPKISDFHIKFIDISKQTAKSFNGKISFCVYYFSRLFFDHSTFMSMSLYLYLATKFWMYVTWCYYYWPCILYFATVKPSDSSYSMDQKIPATLPGCQDEGYSPLYTA